jgi:hypothetical protein
MLWIFVTIGEAAEDQLDQGRMQPVEVWGAFRRPDQ